MTETQNQQNQQQTNFQFGDLVAHAFLGWTGRVANVHHSSKTGDIIQVDVHNHHGLQHCHPTELRKLG